jgi:hypothetical protein
MKKIICKYCGNQTDIKGWNIFEISHNDRFIQIIVCPLCDGIEASYKPDNLKCICPNCGRECFITKIDTFANIEKRVVLIECLCGLITTFDFTKLKKIDLGPCGRN